MRLNAARSASGRRLQTQRAVDGDEHPLVRVDDERVGRSTPSNAQRSSGQTMADPAYAASTWSHARARTASAIAGTGSTDAVDVVPTVATTAHAPSRSERVGAKPEVAVHGRPPQVEAEDLDGLLDRRVGLL